MCKEKDAQWINELCKEWDRSWSDHKNKTVFIKIQTSIKIDENNIVWVIPCEKSNL